MTEQPDLFSGEALDPSAEIDLTDAGFSVPDSTIWTITSSEVEDMDDARTRVVVEFEASVNGNDFTVKDRYWLKHPTEGAVNAGKGGLKRLFRAALGQPKGSVNALLGKRIKAAGSEDAEGFRRLTKIKPAN